MDMLQDVISLNEQLVVGAREAHQTDGRRLERQRELLRVHVVHDVVGARGEDEHVTVYLRPERPQRLTGGPERVHEPRRVALHAEVAGEGGPQLAPEQQVRRGVRQELAREVVREAGDDRVSQPPGARQPQ